MLKFIQKSHLSTFLIVSLIAGTNIALLKVFSNDLSLISVALIQSGPGSLVSSFFRPSSIKATGVQKTGAQISQGARPQVISKARYYIVEGTTSPNKRYVIAMGLPGKTSTYAELESENIDNIENYLVDIKANKIITTLHNCRYYPHQAKGGLLVKWSTNSQLAFVAHQWKWEPGAVLVVSSDGTQTSILKQLVKDTRSHLAKYNDTIYQRTKDRLVFDLVGSDKLFQFNNNLLQFPVLGYIPKEVDIFNNDTLLTYQVKKVSNHIRVKVVNAKSIEKSY